MRRPLRLGAALVVLYTAVALATGSWAPGRLRPLFDGFASHEGSYGWVKPPKELAKGNRPPDRGQGRITFGAEGSTAVKAETPDGQVMASLPAGAVPRHPFDAAARLEVRPVDSTTLGPLPTGLRPESNAYQVTIAFLPTGDLVPTLAAPGSVGLTAAAPADTLLFAADGRTWRQVEATPLNRANALTGPFAQTGYYLAASHAAPRSTGSSGGGAPVGLFVIAAAVPLLLGYLLLGRRRLAERSAKSGSATAKGRSASKGKAVAKKAAPPGTVAPKGKATTEKAAPPGKAAPKGKATTKEAGSAGKAPSKGKAATKDPGPVGAAAPTGEAATKEEATIEAPPGMGAPDGGRPGTGEPSREGGAATEVEPAPEGRWPLAPPPEPGPADVRGAAPEGASTPVAEPAPEGSWPQAPMPGGQPGETNPAPEEESPTDGAALEGDDRPGRKTEHERAPDEL